MNTCTKRRMRVKWCAVMAALLLLCQGLFLPETVLGATLRVKETKVDKYINAMGKYSNWDGVTNVHQFLDEKGELCFAYEDSEYVGSGKYVKVVKTKKGTPTGDVIKLKKKGKYVGAVTCDENGNYYVVTSQPNEEQKPSKNTLFVTKYDAKGKLKKTVGDNGSSSLASYYDESFYSMRPFEGGNCDVAINGDYLAVNYARTMYSQHQSNSLLLIDLRTMEKIKVNSYYNSHSFAQRVVPYQSSFLMASEGDCYDRAFTISTVDIANQTCSSENTFHFWVKKGTLDEYNMYILNDNFAHMGGLGVFKNDTAIFASTSVKSLNKNAEKQNEQLFVQIFYPQEDLSKASGYVTTGKRSGLSGGNGDQKVTNYGVKWLTNYGKEYEIENPQLVMTDKGNAVILFERYKNSEYQGVYYMVLNENGKVTKKTTKLASNVKLNHAEMPVYTNGRVYWMSNQNYKDRLVICSFSVK